MRFPVISYYYSLSMSNFCMIIRLSFFTASISIGFAARAGRTASAPCDQCLQECDCVPGIPRILELAHRVVLHGSGAEAFNNRKNSNSAFISATFNKFSLLYPLFDYFNHGLIKLTIALEEGYKSFWVVVSKRFEFKEVEGELTIL